MLALTVMIGAAAAALSGCERDTEIRPPDIRFGQDVCDVCHMIISDDRFAAGMIVADERGRHRDVVFDDIGCAFELEAARPRGDDGRRGVLGFFVRDMQTKQWLDATEASYVHSAELHTPMAFGLAAVPDLDRARGLQAEYGGDLITLNEARDRFARGVLHVSALAGQPDGPVLLISTKQIALDDGSTLELDLRTPQQLAPGKHDCVLRATIERDSQREPATDLHLQIDPQMPSMGHGSPGNVHPVHEGDGVYRGRVNFTMSGYWIVHVTVSRTHSGAQTPDDATDTGVAATFDFEVSR